MLHVLRHRGYRKCHLRKIDLDLTQGDPSERRNPRIGRSCQRKYQNGTLTARQIFCKSIRQSLKACVSGFLCIMRQSQGQIEQRDNGCRAVRTAAQRGICIRDSDLASCPRTIEEGGDRSGCLHDRLHASHSDLPHIFFPAFRDAESSISLLQSAQPSPPSKIKKKKAR